MVDAFHFDYNFNGFDVDDHICTYNNLHTIWQAMTSSALVMAPEDVYNMNNIGLLDLFA